MCLRQMIVIAKVDEIEPPYQVDQAAKGSENLFQRTSGLDLRYQCIGKKGM